MSEGSPCGAAQAALQAALAARDEGEVAAAARQFIDALDASDCPEVMARQVLALLRGKRYFNDLRDVAEALLEQGAKDPQVRRQYAQAMIELGNLRVAIDELEALVATLPVGSRERTEAQGLLGRAFKQRYVNAANPASPRAQADLAAAVAAYETEYRADRRHHVWHGINAVALLCRAARDHVDLPEHPAPREDAAAYAEEMLAAISERRDYREATFYDRASAAEACLALGREAEARDWLQGYVADPAADLFEIAGTRRQWVEVWQLDRDHPPGATLIPLLEARLLGADGGQIVVGAADTRQTVAGLEKVHGSDGFVSGDWVRTAQLRALGVARIGRETARGEGTGFVVRGADLHPSFGDEMLLLTNAHVISSHPDAHPALLAEDAVILFEAHDPAETWHVTEELWTSPPGELDATLLRLDRPVTHATAYPIAKSPPLNDGKQRVYVIGHPSGGALAFSLQDSLLLDHEVPRLHYRTPTEPGSSGSPVFNASWKVVGIHHKGGRLPCLNGKPGTYDANEGIFIGNIRKALASQFGEPS